jgi:23S rRNA pseudouridine1911/1915/1917 synthase
LKKFEKKERQVSPVRPVANGSPERPLTAGRQVGSDETGPLLAWLLAALKPMSRTRVKELLQRGHVSVNGTATTRFDHPLEPGDRVDIAHTKPPIEALARAGLSLVHVDDHLIVVDKPAGLLTVATEGERTRTAFAILLDHLQARDMGRPHVVHRLDRETSGLLLFARSKEVRDLLQSQWSAVVKTYLGVVEGVPRPPEGTVRSRLAEGNNLRVRKVEDPDDPAHARLAVTRYKVLEKNKDNALLEVVLKTGRKHQIRVHMADLGCPIIGDGAYGAKTDPARRLGLHAFRLDFKHPATGLPMTFQSPLPDVLKRVMHPKK